jgi:NAD-dependent SIR2 family protein deacetylase
MKCGECGNTAEDSQVKWAKEHKQGAICNACMKRLSKVKTWREEINELQRANFP